MNAPEGSGAVAAAWISRARRDRGLPAPGVVEGPLPAAWARRAPLGAATVMVIATAANGLLFGPVIRCGVALPAAFIVAFGIGARLSWPRVAARLALGLAHSVI